jgi:predicted SprT family Zn-dependent metalloprotease
MAKEEASMPGQLRCVDECKAAVLWRVNSLCEEHRIVRPKITYGLKGSDAWQAFFKQNRIDLNLVLLRENLEDGIQNTAPHELAHLEAWRRGLRRGDFHGQKWKEVMIQFRAAPNPCHDLDLDAALSRTGFFNYRCLCNSGASVSLEMHRRIQASPELYRCKECRQVPVFVDS